MRLGVALSFDVSLGLDELEEYLDTTEKYLQKVKVDFDNLFEAKTKGLTDKEINKFGEFFLSVYGEEYSQYTEIFPRILRNSFLVSAWSLLEHKLALICKWLQKDTGLPLSWKDLNGSTLEQFKKYCSLASLHFSFNDQAWQEIKHYSKVRNCIVHTNGLLAEFQCKGKRGFITYLTVKGIISQKQEIELTPKFCEDVIKTMQVFLNKVIEAHDSQIQK